MSEMKGCQATAMTPRGLPAFVMKSIDLPAHGLAEPDRDGLLVGRHRDGENRDGGLDLPPMAGFQTASDTIALCYPNDPEYHPTDSQKYTETLLICLTGRRPLQYDTFSVSETEKFPLSAVGGGFRIDG